MAQGQCEWGYTGENGPEKWAEKFPEAAGTKQSPVDIDTSSVCTGRNAPDLKWCYSVNHTRSVVNPGYCWRVDENGFDSELRGGPLGNNVYKLEQWHCHWGSKNGEGSEHTVDGRSFSGELHLVHWNTSKYNSFAEAAGKEDGLAVLGVFLIAGEKHNELDKVIRMLPFIQHKGDKVTMSEPLDPANLLPARMAYWTYHGSLTTPPCTESVTWIIFKDPVECSAEQLALMRTLRCSEAAHGVEVLELRHNFRPTLPLGKRELREYGAGGN
ncbi:carbonic anhydrase 1 [Pectinophora gossypiella]|uniref:carbonic anhydrase 1 n=1 Tax=Pectinophora gossypiella TaxID=13191 RepID=UPI00214E1C2C|nr:carbonic anhydrase 1 [Pectinophora gossypiella]